MRFPFRRRKLAQLMDQVVGTIEADPKFWVWERTRKQDEPFPMIYFSGNSNGLFEQQRKAFFRIVSSWSDLFNEAISYVEKNVDWEVRSGTLTPHAIHIDEPSSQNEVDFVIELVEPDEIVVHRVSFVNWKPEAYGFDD